MKFSIDLTTTNIMAIVGKNGVGKTVLFKALQNLITSNTFATTSNTHIYKSDSKIIYSINDGKIKYDFCYNDNVKTLDFKGQIDTNVINKIFVELPIPFGKRFQQFQQLSNQDKYIRSSIISGKTTKPIELIELLNYIYGNDKFNNLVEITNNKNKYYAISLDNGFYIREDYLSSGEYFIINIFKYITQNKKLIAIDEIDISLDSLAQVRFIEKLRELSEKYQLTLLFSTHSLALIKTLQKNELFYMDIDNGICSYEEKSYSYIKSVLYGFSGYDKYILTEDEVLKSFLKFILSKKDIFSKYIILPIGGAEHVYKIMNINKKEEFFEKEENVLIVLDGDMKDVPKYKNDNCIRFSPFEYIEKYVFELFTEGIFGEFSEDDLKNKYNVQRNSNAKDYDKSIYKMLINNKFNLCKENTIFETIIERKKIKVDELVSDLISFLNK